MNHLLGNIEDLMTKFPPAIEKTVRDLDIGSKICAICTSHEVYCWDNLNN